MSGTGLLVDAIGAAMKHLGARQSVIARNIANSDTPGFKARELAAPDFGAMLGAGEGAGGGHPAVARPVVKISEVMARMGASGSSLATIADPDIAETKPDGNNVTLEDQLLKMGQIQSDFAALTSLYRKQMGMVKAALGKGGGV